MIFFQLFFLDWFLDLRFLFSEYQYIYVSSLYCQNIFQVDYTSLWLPDKEPSGARRGTSHSHSTFHVASSFLAEGRPLSEAGAIILRARDTYHLLGPISPLGTSSPLGSVNHQLSLASLCILSCSQEHLHRSPGSSCLPPEQRAEFLTKIRKLMCPSGGKGGWVCEKPTLSIAKLFTDPTTWHSPGLTST